MPGHVPAPHIALYPTNPVNSSSTPLYVQPRAVWGQPCPQNYQSGALPAQAPQVLHTGPPDYQVSSVHQVQGVHPTQYHSSQLTYASPGQLLQPRFLDQNATNGAEPRGPGHVDDGSYTMHSTSMAATSRSEETSGATSEASSSCPYSENTIE